MRQVLLDILKAIAARPPVLWSALAGLVVTMGGRVDALEPYRELGYMVITPLAGYIASRFTIGVETGSKLAQGSLSSAPAKGEARAAALAVLTMPRPSRMPSRFWLILGALLIVVALGFIGLLPKLLAFIGSLFLTATLATHSGLDGAGKAAGFSPEEEVPDTSRRTPSGPISPPAQRDDPEAEPMHPSRRGSD